jgi:tetratricopeptide (TPR) repeat protein
VTAVLTPVARPLLAAALWIVALSGPLSAQDHDHAPAPSERLGQVAFPTSCDPTVQPRFERAVAMLHSFWFGQAQSAFEEVAASDPGCGMAWWGVAMTLWGNPMTRAAPAEERARQGLEAAEKAVSLAGSLSDRERAYIESALALYREQGTVDHLTRMKRHEEALKLVVERHPDDPEAAIFYARAVVANAPPQDLTFERQLHAASILEPIFGERPDHPGLAHYLIHAFDAPPIAEKGLEAARRYSEIAPSAPHALHMPSHIFTRLGYWDESIEMNRRSADAEENPDAAVHPLDYMVYAYLQRGLDAEAIQVVERATELPDHFYGGFLGYNFTAMPARLALERSRWEDAAALTVPTGALPHVEAIIRFARAVGAARAGRPAEAALDVAALVSLTDTLEARGDAYWSTIVEAQRLAAEAWATLADGDAEKALALARQAATGEETVEKHPVTPGPLLPARELLADMLLELERPTDALVEYEKTLEREPRRARALYGAARAAEEAGDRQRARRHYAQLVEVLAPTSSRAELEAARRYLEG